MVLLLNRRYYSFWKFSFGDCFIYIFADQVLDSRPFFLTTADNLWSLVICTQYLLNLLELDVIYHAEQAKINIHHIVTLMAR